MNKIDTWLNLNLGKELDTAGTYIFDSVEGFKQIERFFNNNDEAVFSVLDSASQGIERLLKVAYLLSEYKNNNIDEDAAAEQLVNSIKYHKHLALLEKLESSIGKILFHTESSQRKFLSLLQDFYKNYRYDNFDVPTIDSKKEKAELLLGFISTEFKVSISKPQDPFGPRPKNSYEIKEAFCNELIGDIAESLFTVINEFSRDRNIYLHELTADSKAARVFYGDDLTFDREDITLKELLLFLLHGGDIIADTPLSEIEPLEFSEVGYTTLYKAFSFRQEFSDLADFVESCYEDDLSEEDRKNRTSVLSLFEESYDVTNDDIKQDDEQDNDY